MATPLAKRQRLPWACTRARGLQKRRVLDPRGVTKSPSFNKDAESPTFSSCRTARLTWFRASRVLTDLLASDRAAVGLVVTNVRVTLCHWTTANSCLNFVVSDGVNCIERSRGPQTCGFGGRRPTAQVLREKASLVLAEACRRTLSTRYRPHLLRQTITIL